MARSRVRSRALACGASVRQALLYQFVPEISRPFCLEIVELFYFPNIPPKVTLNEYLEIAKEYSTPKSNLFINGVLDSLVKEYEKTNRMNRQGRGLL